MPMRHPPSSVVGKECNYGIIEAILNHPSCTSGSDGARILSTEVNVKLRTYMVQGIFYVEAQMATETEMDM